MTKPLYTKTTPKKLNEYLGQEHIVGKNKIINNMIENEKPMSLLLYGKPGIGKTTLARIIMKELNATFIGYNAGNQNKTELVSALDQLIDEPMPFLVIDEIHRLDKPKQAYLLQALENGKIFIIGTTTENPYFHVSEALRSRLTILELMPYAQGQLINYMKNIIEQNNFSFNDEEIKKIIIKSGGDIRTILNLLEMTATLELDERDSFLNNYLVNFKTNSSDYYDIVSAYQKSIRGCDVDAALIYLTILLENGHLEEVCRRIIVISYEDIGFGNMNAIQRVKASVDSAKVIGMPEALYPLAFSTIELALSPKSRIVGQSFGRAKASIRQNSDLVIPEFIKYKNKHLYYPHYEKPSLFEKNYKPKGIDEQIIDFSFVSNTKYELFLIDQYNKLKNRK